MTSTKFAPFIKRYPWYVWSFILLLPFIFIVLSGSISEDIIQFIDRSIGQPILSLRNPTLTPFFIFLTDLGGTIFLGLFVLLTAVLCAWRYKNRSAALWLVVQSVLGAGLLNQLLKVIFQRARPVIEHLVEQGGLSFPSGHSMGSMICYGGILFLLTKIIRQEKLRIGLFIFAAVLILLIGISRIYLGVHFATDVIGGFSAGAAWLSFTIGTYPKWKSFISRSK